MSNRHLIFYNDARHYHIYCYDPPLTIEEAQAPIDEIAGTGVDTFAYGFGVGPTMFHNTKVGEIWGTRITNAGKTFSQDDPNNLYALSSWRAYENLKSLRDRGLDILEILIDRAHEKGLEFIGSLRTTHHADPKRVDTEHTWQFRIDHPEWCLKGRGKHNFNWIYPEVRRERLALVEEAVNRYDMDGFEVDYVFDPSYFEEGQVEQNTHIMTAFMRDVSDCVRQAADKRGRAMTLGARVLPTLSANRAVGLDVSAWLKEGLLQFVVPTVYADHQMDVGWSFEWLLELAQASGCEVYPALQARMHTAPVLCDYPRTDQHAAHEGVNMARLEHYRAGAASYWSRGADAIYLPWFKWPVGAEQRQILSEIHDPALLRDKSKHYVARQRPAEYLASSYGFDPDTIAAMGKLPLKLETGVAPSGQTVKLYVADEPDQCKAQLKLRFVGSTSHDVMTVTLNGKPLLADGVVRTEYGGYLYTWIEFPLPPDMWHKGHNEVGVAVESRPANLTVDVVLAGVELVVERAE